MYKAVQDNNDNMLHHAYFKVRLVYHQLIAFTPASNFNSYSYIWYVYMYTLHITCKKYKI